MSGLPPGLDPCWPAKSSPILGATHGWHTSAQCLARQVDTLRLAIQDDNSDTVNVVISDLMLPGMTGMEFMRRARERDPDFPILVITGAPGVESAIQSIEAGVFRYARALALARRAAGRAPSRSRIAC